MRGVLYIALNDRTDVYALRSCKSLRKHMDIATRLVTDQHVREKEHNAVFDDVVHVPLNFGDPELDSLPQAPDKGLIAKVKHMWDNSFDFCLFLDVDTFVLDDLSDVFQLLKDGNDLAVAVDSGGLIPADEIPTAFPLFNTGVIAWRKNKKTEQLFQRWWAVYEAITKEKRSGWGDQPAFRKALYYSDVRWVTLRPEYNCRWIYPTFVWYPVKILHGRGEQAELERIGREINKDHQASRVWYSDRLLCTYKAYEGFKMT